MYYVHADHLNTPRLVTDTSSNIRWRWDSDPFGTSIPNENPASLGAFIFNLRFPGQQYDPVVGLHYNYFRDYDPAVGRYVQSDPIGLRGGINTYAYARSVPTMRTDRFGLLPGGFGQPGSDALGRMMERNRNGMSGTSYFGGEFHFLLGAGLTSVTCKDECGASQTFRYIKVCGGGAIGGSASGGVVSGMEGKQCRSERYEGWFYELGGSLGPLGGGFDDGFDKRGGDGPGRHLPNGNRSGVSELSLGLGLGLEFKSTWCHYWPLQ
jgi:RHS repeat-associated protein